MKKLILFFYFALIFVMAVATLVERLYGTSWVVGHIYHSPLFVSAWALLALLTVAVCCRVRMWRRIFALSLHLSFVVILAGAALSFLTGRKGMLHLRVGASTFQFIEEETRLTKELPFVLRLDSFWIETYPGTDMPSDYVSRVTCLPQKGKERHSDISMNRILAFQGYRFYQSSYDEDRCGSWLSVNYDPWGTPVTYAGYLLFGISMMGVLLVRRSSFRRLLDHPLLKGGAVGGLMSLVCMPSFAAGGGRLPVITDAEADSLAVRQVVYQGRVVPFHTVAVDFMRKLSGGECFEGLPPEQVVGSWMKYPEAWKYAPVIRMKSGELRRRLGLGEAGHVCLADLWDGGHYRLRDFPFFARPRQGKPSALEKAVMEADEKVALVGMLLLGAWLKPLPDDGSVKPLSVLAVKAELLYNRIPFSKWLFMFNLSLGFLSFGWMLYRSLRAASQPSYYNALQGVLMWLSLLFHLSGYLLRWYIGGRIPLANGYETMQLLALCILVVALVLRRRLAFIVPSAWLLSGFVLLVAHLGQMNPQITPLMPVLVSPWLGLHVSCIMVSYALLGFVWLNAWLGLCLPREAMRLMVCSRVLLYPAMLFLGVGIFIGAVWANVSWGRYWAWDPKEVWALVTFMVYGVAFHADSLPWMARPRSFHVYMLLAFLTVLMTYFGVNSLLGGMHSYA